LPGGDSDGGTGRFGGGGGGVYQDGDTATFEQVTITGNRAGDSGDGGDGGTAGNGGDNPGAIGGDGANSVGGAAVDAGVGGGVELDNGGMSMTDSTVSGNHAGVGGAGGAGGKGGNGGDGNTIGDGGDSHGGGGGVGGQSGGMSMSPSDTVTIARTSISGNVAGDGGAGGAGGTGGTGTTAGTSQGGGAGQGGDGGGGTGDSFGLTNATIAANRAGAGGKGGAGGHGPNGSKPGDGGKGGGAAGFFANGGTPVFTHVTVASNLVGAGGAPGAQGNAGSGVNQTGASGAAGTVGGIDASGATNLGLTNTIVANNTAPQCAGSFAGASAGNLEFPNNSSCLGVLVTSNPLLGALADNGGLTPTMMLGAGSPAIDKVTLGCVAADQRGVPRPRGASCDIGAVEKSPPTATTQGSSALTPTAATVLGTANARHVRATYRFQYGTTTASGRQSAAHTLAASDTDVPVSVRLRGLAPNRTYHYRLVVQSPDGIARGADRTFKTPRRTFPGVAIVSRSARPDSKRRVRVRLSCPAAAFRRTPARAR
jgi:hypothetical protein